MLIKLFVIDVEYLGIGGKNGILEMMVLLYIVYELFNECVGVILFIIYFLLIFVFY